MGKKMEERTWFTPRQEQFIKLVGQSEWITQNFYLTGGTALSACYYNHRISLDLDFFSAKSFDNQEIRQFVLSTKSALAWKSVKRLSKNIHGYQLAWGSGETLIVDFSLFSFKRLKPGKSVFGVGVDSLMDIAANKLEVTLLRTNARDYVDLYWIMEKEGFLIREVKLAHRKKFEIEVANIDIIKALLKSREVFDYPKMKMSFNKKDMLTFFEVQARDLGKDIIN